MALAETRLAPSYNLMSTNCLAIMFFSRDHAVIYLLFYELHVLPYSNSGIDVWIAMKFEMGLYH
jgi:hypothetical protein